MAAAVVDRTLVDVRAALASFAFVASRAVGTCVAALGVLALDQGLHTTDTPGAIVGQSFPPSVRLSSHVTRIVKHAASGTYS